MANGDSDASNLRVPADSTAGRIYTDADSATAASRLFGDSYSASAVVAPVGNANLTTVAAAGDASIYRNFSPAPAFLGDISTAAPIDGSKQVPELIKAGTFRKMERASVVTEPLKPGEVPQVTLTYSDTANNGTTSSEPTKSPDFIVRQNGQIEAAPNFENGSKKSVVIQVERAPGQTSDPSDAQQKSIDNLMQYVNDRISVNPDLASRGLNISDQYGLMSDKLSQKIAAGDFKPSSNMTDANSAMKPYTDFINSPYSPESRRAMSDMNRFSPGSSGSMSQREVNDYFPRRDVGQSADETNSVVHAKNAVAAMFRPDKTNPYETVRSRGDQGLAVGRYGLTYRQWVNWMSSEGDMEFSEDNIAGIMANLAKKGKVSKEFAAKFQDKNFAHKFVGAMKRMQEGKQVSGEEMRTLFPKDLQERVATDTVDKFMKASGNDIGKTALAMHLGKEPGQLTVADLSEKSNKTYMEGATKLAQLSELRRDMGQNDRVDWQVGPEGNLMKNKIVKAGLAVAADMRSEGACAAGVQVALNKVGMGEFMGSGNGWDMRKAFLNNDEWRVTNDPTKATAFVRSWNSSVQRANGGANYGHVGLLHTENGRLIETSDHKTVHDVNNPRYNKTIYFEYVGKQPKTMQA